MNQHNASDISEQLERGETLLWTGEPKHGIVFRTADIFMIPFSLLWGGFAFYWTYAVAQVPGPIVFFGIPFVIFGLIFIFGRFLIDAKLRANTVYGLTQYRAIIISGIFSKNIQSLHIKTIGDIELTEKNDGTGTISLGPKNPYMMWGSGMNWLPGVKASPQLELIENARTVYAQIIAIQNES